MMIKNQKLKNIAEIISGYSFRASVSDYPQGDIFFLQSRNLLANMSLDLNTNQKLDFKDVKTKAFTKRNDILLGSKGNHTIGYVENDYKILVSSSIYIIRVSNQTVLPRFLAIYLDSTKGHNELSKITLGGYIKGISKTNLEELQIPIPSMDIQKKMISLYDNIVKQKALLEMKSTIYNEILDSIINNLTF